MDQLIYTSNRGNDMWEHELDPLFICAYNESSIPSHPHAVCATQWMRIADLQKDHDQNPDQYAAWFKPAFNRVVKKKSMMIL